MAAPAGLRYTKTHEWVLMKNDIVRIGITDHAQEELGDVALVQLPEVGRVLQSDEIFGEIESIKAVSELYAPVGGEVVAVNEKLQSGPEQVNTDPYGEGWMVEIRLKTPADVDSLMDETAYAAFANES